MASARVAGQSLSAGQYLPESVNIPIAQFPPSDQTDSVDANSEATAIIEALNRSVRQADYEAISELFVRDGFWRDHLALSWEFRTVKGKDDILGFLKDCADSKDGFRLKQATLDASTRPREPKVVPIDGEARIQGIQAFFLFSTVIGSGEGVMRLVLQDGNWKIFTIYTSLRELRGHEEATFHHRPQGTEHGAKPGRKNWAEERRLETDFLNEREPTVLVVGAGQSGLTVGARLKALGLALHDPLWYNSLPYLEYPATWPIFAPKDKFAQFLEAYATLLELDVWVRTELSDCTWNEKNGAWDVTVVRKLNDGSTHTRTFHPHHIVQATGHSGEKHQPWIKGMDTFQGDRICHSSEFPGARDDGNGKKAVVIGCCNSGHDIAQDFVEKGYDVTIVQRSSTTVLSSRAITDIFLQPAYCEDGPPVHDADILVNGLPNSVLKAMNVTAVEHQKKLDKDMLSGLEKAGFKVNYGSYDSGLFFQYFQRGGGYYIDVGAAACIAEGRIKIKQGQEVAEILPHGMRFADGTELEADEIILATGYQNMRTGTRLLFGDEVADRVGDVWGFNDEGEIRTMWQRSGHPGFWFHGGNLALCRFFSRLLALQIKGLEEGVYSYGEK